MYTKAFPFSQQHEFHKSRERGNRSDMPTKPPSVWARSTTGFTLAREPWISHHLHMIWAQGWQGVRGRRKGASLPRAHEAAKRPQKGKNLSLSPCLSRTHTCTHTHWFGAKCSQLFLWTPEVLLLGLQELTEGQCTAEEKGSCHLRSRIQVFGGLLETWEDAGSSKLKLWVKASYGGRLSSDTTIVTQESLTWWHLGKASQGSEENTDWRDPEPEHTGVWVSTPLGVALGHLGVGTRTKQRGAGLDRISMNSWEQHLEKAAKTLWNPKQ